MAVHVMAYYAAGGVSGVARVESDRERPAWFECRAQVPGFITGRYLGLADESGEQSHG